MGMFDYISGTCPNCGGLLNGQTKSGNCILDNILIKSEMPYEEAHGLNHEEVKCEGECGKVFEINVGKAEVVKVSLKEKK